MIFKFSKSIWFFLFILSILTILVFLYKDTLIDFIMFVPGFSGILTSFLFGRNWSSFGLKFSFKYALLAWSIPILYSALAYFFIWGTGIGEFPNPVFLERAKLTIGLDTDSSFQIIFISFFYITIIMLIPSIVFALGEELGWRGFLFPELHKKFSFLKASFISSFFWALWHFPAILFENYGFVETPLIFRLIMFLLLILFTGTIMSWLWKMSKSILAVSIFHASHNVVIQMFFDRVTLDNLYTKYFKGEFGIALVLSSLIFVLFILNKFNKSYKVRKINY